MKLLVQRVSSATCVVAGEAIGVIEKGLLCFVSFRRGDQTDLIPIMAKKLANLRVFEDEAGKMNLSVKDLNLSILTIPQFTLEANTQKGYRPSFTEALSPNLAKTYYEAFNEALKKQGVSVEEGEFAAHMHIHASNDGPVSLLLERTSNDD